MKQPFVLENLSFNVPLTVTDAISELSVAMHLSDEEVKGKFGALAMDRFKDCIVIIERKSGNGFSVMLYDKGKKEPRHGYGVDELGQVWD